MPPAHAMPLSRAFRRRLAVPRRSSQRVERIVEVAVTGTPSKVVFYPKDDANIWGPDSDASDYYVVLSQEEQVRAWRR